MLVANQNTVMTVLDTLNLVHRRIPINVNKSEHEFEYRAISL